MQSIRIRTPQQVHRVCRAVPTTYTPTRTMAFFPRFPAGEFAPLFRLLDDYASHQLTRDAVPAVTRQVRSFQPRFDVREVKDAYELHGELPGIDQENISIEFTDAQTLSIRGRSERSTKSGSQATPTATLEDSTTTAEATPIATPDTDSETSSGYHKASVEDEGTSEKAPSADESQVDKTQTESTVTSTTAPQQQQQQHRYWVSERSIGEFSRTFNFPSRVDQEKVRASLKNGILSIVVPKAAAPVYKKITVE